MKKVNSFVIICLLGMSFAFSGIDGLNIGDSAPMTDIEMISTDDAVWTLESAAKDNGLLVIFSCNTCPFVLAWEDRYNELAEMAKDNKIGMIVVNSNSAYRSEADSKQAMIEKAKTKGYKFPYVIDEENALADSFGATKTPDVFLFNKDLNLAYKGAIDNSGGRGEASEEFLMSAMKKMIKGVKIDPNSTKSIGCSIKRS